MLSLKDASLIDDSLSGVWIDRIGMFRPFLSSCCSFSLAKIEKLVMLASAGLFLIRKDMSFHTAMFLYQYKLSIPHEIIGCMLNSCDSLPWQNLSSLYILLHLVCFVDESASVIMVIAWQYTEFNIALLLQDQFAMYVYIVACKVVVNIEYLYAS